MERALGNVVESTVSPSETVFSCVYFVKLIVECQLKLSRNQLDIKNDCA